MDRSLKLMYVYTETHLFVERSLKPTVLSTQSAIFVDRNRKTLLAPVYTSPTNARVAMLILTLGGKTARRASKQACKVLPVVKTSSTRRI